MNSFFSKFGASTKSFFGKMGSYAKNHKIISAIVVILVAGGGYYAYASMAANATTAQYVLAATTNAPIQSTVTGSGEVASEHQLDLAPKASGAVTAVYVKPGDAVAAGQIVAEVDMTDAANSVRDARANVESAQISYTQAVTSANNSVTNSQTSVTTASDSGFSALAAAASDLTTVTTGLNSILLGTTDIPGYPGEANISAYASLIQDVEPGGEAAREQAMSSYQAAIDSYNQVFAAYQAAGPNATTDQIQSLLTQMMAATAKANEATKDAYTFLSLVNSTVTVHNDLTTPPSLASQISTISSYVTKVNSDQSSLASAASAITTAEQNLQSNTQSISGGTPLSVQTAQINLTKAQNALTDAETTEENYIVRAPFAGTIATVDVQKFDQATAGTKVATLITTQQYADLSLNETDAANVKVGQKATITFDAIDGLTINGTVAEVAGVGTVSQGVVSYDVKIGFDTQDSRIMPGMTANATIVTASKDSAIVVPSAAVKSQGNNYYVQVATITNPTTGAAFSGTSTAHHMRIGTSTTMNFAGAASSSLSGKTLTGANTSGGATRTQTVNASDVTVRNVTVTIGITSDTMTEITSGLAPGQFVVTSSLNASGKTTTQSKSIFSLFGVGGARSGTAAGGATRAAGASGTGGNASFGGAARTTGAGGAVRVGG